MRLLVPHFHLVFLRFLPGLKNHASRALITFELADHMIQIFYYRSCILFSTTGQKQCCTHHDGEYPCDPTHVIIPSSLSKMY
ncbi:hypothetical protein HMPREF9413_1683 [Paenibacillus sp. HGF7]|nr:hypothetical protein HMPREF9413_1683 [Paenibacillus sp. HGF7]